MKKNYVFLLSLLYLLAVTYTVFFISKRLNTDFRSSINYIPFRKIFIFFRYYSNYDITKTILFWIELFGNLILLVPLPLIISLLFPKYYSKKSIFITLFIASILIEGLQLALNIGVFDIDDIILNFSGGFICIYLYNKLVHTLSIKS